MKLYVCLTYYHLLITVVKSLVNHETYDLLVANDIPEYQEIYTKLAASTLFNQVIEYKSAEIRKQCNSSTMPRYIEIFSRKKRIDTCFRQYCTIDFAQYSDIYLYHDITEIGSYFTSNKIDYHLLEDALDYFKYFDTYYGIGKSSYDERTIKCKLKIIFGLGYQAWGISKYCIDVEVNDLNGLKIRNDKYFELPRKKMFEKLSTEQKKMVYSLFAGGKTLSHSDEDAILLCTQPLYTSGHVSSYDIQLKVFESIIRDYTVNGYQVVLKPHPRDEADYTALITKYKCGYIDKNLPSEILDYNPDIKPYYAAVSVTSTAINFLDCAKNKVFMGMEYIKKIEEKVYD